MEQNFTYLKIFGNQWCAFTLRQSAESEPCKMGGDESKTVIPSLLTESLYNHSGTAHNKAGYGAEYTRTTDTKQPPNLYKTIGTLYQTFQT